MTSALLAIIIVSIIGLALTWWSRLPDRPDLPPGQALDVAEESPLDDLLGPLERQHPDQSAYRMVSDGQEAFVLRARSAQAAVRSLDVQTYIWHDDLTGLSLAQELLQAADRGVRVRLLVDDFDARAHNRGYSILAAHEYIAVRLFNPFTSRSGFASKVLEGVHNLARLNHRMHNKSWVADNRLALVGGRNLGDEYFDASSDLNFVDLDVALFGPIVRQVSNSFDDYWNAAASYPMEVLDPEAVRADHLPTTRRALDSQIAELGESRYQTALQNNESIRQLLAGDWELIWTADGRFVADVPMKSDIEDEDQRSRVLSALAESMLAAQSEVTIISPYFVPGDEGTRGLVELAEKGVAVRIMTNSLAANDVAAVHGGYARHRDELLAGGVELWELMPSAGQQGRGSLFGSSNASLHTKALSVDGETVFVGSYNLDPRSTSLNTEQGVLVRAPRLATELDQLFDQAAQRAWQVSLMDDELVWSDGEKTWMQEPEATRWRRFQAWMADLLNLDAQL